MRIPGRLEADNLITDNWPGCEVSGGRYVRARPEPFSTIGRRWQLAWAVFTGKADALFWTEQ